MSDRAMTVRLLREKFPAVGEGALRLYDQDEDFRELCDDYTACVQAAMRLGSANSGSEPIRQEYAHLQLRLERELLQYLEDHRS